MSRFFLDFFKILRIVEELPCSSIPWPLWVVFLTQNGVRFPLLGTTIENEGASRYIALPASRFKLFPRLLVYYMQIRGPQARMPEKTDEVLIKRFQEGDVTAFNELVRRYQERVYWIARRLVGDHADADDVAQEVFIKTYDSLRGFRSESTFYTWVYRVTVNASLNLLRRKKVRAFVRFDEIITPLLSDEPKPDEHLESKEQKTRIDEAIARLPNRQRTVFVLRYYENLPYDEIAKLLKRSVGGMKANYFQAVQKISRYLKESQ
jgi:RNA polymerase sigma factor (sigma-70 family)